MLNFVFNEHELLRDFVSHIVGEEIDHRCTAIGLERDGNIRAAVVYTDFTGASISMHVGAVPNTFWTTKKNLYVLFAYPFLQLGCNRVTALIRTDNFKSIKFNEHVGFVREGLVRQGCADGTDLILYGMLKDECRWIKEVH